METPITPTEGSVKNDLSNTVALYLGLLLLGGCTSEKPSTFTDEPGSFNTMIPVDSSNSIQTIQGTTQTIDPDSLSEIIKNSTPEQVYGKIENNELNLMLTFKALDILKNTKYFEEANDCVKKQLYNLILKESNNDSTVVQLLYESYSKRLEEVEVEVKKRKIALKKLD